jgi:hypothetical protein
MTFLHLSLIWLSFAAAVLALPVLYVYLSPATRGLGEHARLRAALADASISGVISIPLGDEEVQQEESTVRGLIAAELIGPAFKAGVRGNVLMEALTRNSSLLPHSIHGASSGTCDAGASSVTFIRVVT